MLALAADFSFTWPTAQELLAAGVQEVYFYCGPALPPKARIDAWVAAGLKVVAIFETYSSRAEDSGYAGGVADATYWQGRMASVGYPDIAAAFVMSDGNRYSPAGVLPGTAEYSRGVGDRLGRSFIAYGNEAAVSAAQRGSRLATVDWIPETWTDRANQGIRQQVGPVPINGIDLNDRFVPLPGQVPVAQPKGAVHGMWIATRAQNSRVQAIKCGGNMWVADCTGPPGAFGIPQDALDAHARGVELVPVDDLTWDRLVSNAQSSIPRAAAEAHILAAIKAIPQATGAAGLSVEEVEAAVREALAGAPITLSGKVGG